MTLLEALSELGLSSGFTEEELRSAYLRLLRVKKPEKDPVGFARLREAYDLLRVQRPAEQPAPNAQRSPPPVPSPPSAEPIRESTKSWHEAIAAGNGGNAEQMAASLQRALTASIAEPDAPSPPPTLILQLILKLHLHGQGARASAMWPEFKRWLGVAGAELALAREALTTLMLVEQLSALPPAFPDKARSLIAEALLRGSVKESIPKLLDFARDNKGDAAAAFAMLKKFAPVLHGVLGTYLGTPQQSFEMVLPPAEPHRPWARPTVQQIIVAVTAVVLVVLLVLPLVYDSTDHRERIASDQLVARICVLADGAVLAPICYDSVEVQAETRALECTKFELAAAQLRKRIESTPASKDPKESLPELGRLADDLIKMGRAKCPVPGSP